ncbi:MAG: CARDB domain-containing protein, partial [Rubripirellula sp.]
LRLSSGTLVLNEGWDVSGAGSLLVTGGTLDAAADGHIENLSLGSSSAAYLIGAGDVTVGGLFTWTGGRLQGTGTLIASGGIQMSGSTKYLERTLDNAGTANWTGGRINATADGEFNNLVGATFDAQTNNLMYGTFNNAGTLLKSVGTGPATLYATVNNSGTVQVKLGTLNFRGGYSQTEGETILDGGNLTSTAPLIIQEGALTGFGVVFGDVLMGGRLAPNSSAGDTGAIRITGDYIQSPTLDAGGPYSVDEDGSVQLDATLSDSNGVLEIEIGGLAELDQLDVDGSLTLTGPLNVMLTSGFEPSVGDSFTIVNNAGTDAIIGAFAGLPEGATFTVGTTQFQITYAGGTDNNDVVLTAVNSGSPDLGSDTFTFQWDLDGDGTFGETGAAAQRGDELGDSVSFSAEGLFGPATFPVGVRAAFSTGAFSAVSTTNVELSDRPAVPLPDLLIQTSNISFSPANPNPGEMVTINANIENLGQIAASDIQVGVYDFDVLIEQVTIPSLAVGATQEISVTTSFAELGSRSITVKVDPLDSILELNEENNEASRPLQVADTISPTTSLVRAPEANAVGWNNTDVSLTLNAIDSLGGSGVSHIAYSINGGAPVSEPGDSVSLLLTDEGIHTVRYYAVDAALNAEAERSVQVRIDKTAPVPVYSGPFIVDEGSSTLPDGSTSTDALSGVGSIAWSVAGDGEFVSGGSQIFSSLDGPATRDVLLRVTDLAGNEATVTSQVSVYNVEPEATISSGGTFTYGQAVTVGLSGPTDPSTADTAAGFRYSFGLSTGDLANTYLDADESSSWSSELAVGTYTVYGRILDVDNAYSDYETSVTVEQATVTVTADDTTRPYTGAVVSDFNVSYSGFVLGDDAGVLGGSVNFGGSAIGATDVGVYAIEVGGLTSDNYVVNFASGQLTIEKANANVAVNGTTTTYDGTEYSATGSVVGVNDEPLTGLELSGTFIDAPGGTANWSFRDATGNYNDASGSVAINILKAEQTLDWATPAPIVEGTPLSATQLNATVSVVGPSLAGELQYAPGAGAILSIGVNELSVTASETTNYLAATESVLLTVEDPNVVPTIEFDSPPSSVVRDVPFMFDGSFTDPDADSWTATVNYGDGSGDQPLVITEKNFQLAHTYGSEGPYVIVVTIDDGEGGVASKNLTVVVNPPPRADVTLISSDVLFDPINPDAGDPVNFVIDVTNDGTVAAANVAVSVQFFDASSDSFLEIGRALVASLAAESEAEIGLTWDGTGSQPALPVDDAYLLVRVVLDPDNTIQEEDESNNEAIQVLQIGSPDFGSAGLVANVNPVTTTRGTYTAVGGQAYYDFSTIPGSNDFPVQNASVTARLIDQATGEVLRVSSDQTAPTGNFFHLFRAPEVDGVYTLQYEINEGTLSGVFESTLTVDGEPTVTPRGPRSPGGPGYVFSPSIVPPESLEIGEAATIIGSFDYELDIPLLDVPVTFNNLFPVAGQLQTFEIGSGTVSFPDGGLDEPTTLPMQWTPTAEGYHILQVIAQPDFDFRARTHVTQLVLVGDLDTTSLNVEYTATVVPDLPPEGSGEGEEDGGSSSADDTPSPGDTLFYTLQYENTGSTTITGGFLMDDFDETLLGTPTNISDGGMVDGNVIRWDVGDIAPGESGFVTYEVTINSGAELPPGSAYLLNTAILNADQSVAANTNELVISNNAPVISGLNVDSVVDENGSVTLTGTFSDATTDDTHQVYIAWGDETSDTLSFTQGERAFSIEHTYDIANLSGVESVEIAVSITDGSNQSVAGSVETIVHVNEAPTANAGGTYTVGEGLQVVLDGSNSTDPDLPGDVLTFQWDLDGDGVFGETGSGASLGDETGVAPTFDAGTLDGPTSVQVALQFTDSFGESSTDTTTVNV